MSERVARPGWPILIRVGGVTGAQIARIPLGASWHASIFGVDSDVSELSISVQRADFDLGSPCWRPSRNSVHW